MSFFGRAANLLKGGIKSVTRPDSDHGAGARALEEELARAEKRVPARSTATPPTRPAQPEAPAVEPHGPPERDEQGNVKRTL
ncbi:MAG: hypothetical protein Q8P41_03395 [Pseudomonadota bacterium]|nr:hypothetical protein [Pseudomonadota bacterium]